MAVEALTNLTERIVRALEEPNQPDNSWENAPATTVPERFTVADETAFNRLALEEGWSDGLPLVAPSRDRVAEVLVPLGVDPDTIVAVLPPSGAPATVAALATNAVMAGCVPSDFPVVIAAVKALAHPEFYLDLIQVTTSPATPMIVVNGPVAARIGLNGGTNALGPGSRANATIGRAVRLILQNIGGAVPGTIDMATLGQPGKYAFCFAENEAASPWEPLLTGAGFSRGQSAVTAIAAGGICEIRDSESQSADFDALPCPGQESLLAPDVLTVHHEAYYRHGSTEAPADWDDPNPVPFLTATGRYLVALAGPGEWVEATFEILRQALDQIGIGAKTSSGYGRMTLEAEPSEGARTIGSKQKASAPSDDPDQAIVDAFIQSVDALPMPRVAPQIEQFARRALQLPVAPVQRKRAARAVIEKVRAAGREQRSANRPWYQDLLALLDEGEAP